MLGGVPCKVQMEICVGGGFFMWDRLGWCMLGGVPCTDPLDVRSHRGSVTLEVWSIRDSVH